MRNVDQIVCVNCWNVVLGLDKTKGAEYYKINNSIFCSLTCYHEDYAKPKVVVSKKQQPKRKKKK